MRMLAVLVVALGGAVLYAADPHYGIVEEIPIGGDGGWDYIVVDSPAHRVYVSHSTKIVVADAGSGQIVGEIPDTPGVHGIALAPDLGRGFTSNGRSNTSTIVDLKTLKPIGTVQTGANPDSIRYLADRHEVWTFNHTAGSITAFDPMSGRVIATMEVGGRLEEAVEDPAVGRVYVNIEDRNTMAVLDTRTHTLVATWPLPGCHGPTGLSFDARNRLLLSACEGRMLVIDSGSGKPVTGFPIGTAVDGNGFDPETGLAFASSGAGVLTIAHEDAPGRFTVVQTVKTQPSGRTMALDPGTHRVYVPVASTSAGSSGRAQIAAGTMKVLVLGPQP
jgi:DNA-binding beta-propeller fold protein YncE